tara:strand:- start:24733 stop:25428 length:696 start_codon:yes stop_codon:yes gene_type:complete
MIKHLKSVAKGLAVSLVLATPTLAEETWITELEDGSRVVVFVGQIELGASVRLEALLNLNPDIDRIIMASPGGRAMEGFYIAEVLSDNNMTALVPAGYSCLSACAIGFLGAENYRVEGALGFHSMWVSEEDMADIPDLTLLLMGQNFGVRSTLFFLSNGFEIQLPVLVSTYTGPEEFIVFTSTEDLMTFFARSDTDTILEYFEDNNIDEVWLDEHLWGTPEFMEFYGEDEE